MKILVAPDKFKHSLNTFQVIDAIHKGLKQASETFEIIGLPMADGGDHFSEVLGYYTNGHRRTVTVLDPLFRPVEATYFISGRTAFVEMAKASGLQLLKPDEYNCLYTTTYGTGQIIKDVLLNDVDEIVLGVGGSATNDCGTGMAAALGFRFLDEKGKEVSPTGANLINIHTIEAPQDTTGNVKRIVVASDVTNFLTGPNGATKIFAPQKGASPGIIEQLEEGAAHFAIIVKRDLGVNILNIEGGGAAGGLGAGSFAFLGAELVSGAELVFRYSQAERHISEADIVITGEGKIDQQSLHGKLLFSISSLCKKYHKPLLAFCGTLALPTKELNELGVTAAFSIMTRPMNLDESYKNAADLLEQVAYNIGNILKIGKLNTIPGKPQFPN